MSVEVVVWDPASADADAHFNSVLAIHKANRATLGPMPDTAFRDRAGHQGLLLGMAEGIVSGYVLYDIPRTNLIKLVHVCVTENARGTGLARDMVQTAIQLNPRRSEIVASCRTDYGMNGFWRSLGMHIASERPGRALNGSILMNWVKRINIDRGLDLLESAFVNSSLPIAVLDTNVINDLFSPPEIQRDHRDETMELLADWLQPLVTFAVSGEVDTEVSQNQDRDTRTKVRAASQHLMRLSTLRPSDRRLEDDWLAATDPRTLAKDPSLRLDALHLADAIHAGADYFVTNDSNVHRAAATAWNIREQRIQVVRPHELIAALSPEAYLSDFRSNLIDDGDLEWQEVTSAEPNLESAFREYGVERRPSVFDQRLRELLAKRRTVRVQKLVDRKGALWALAAYEIEGGTLRLPMIRATRGERGSTVAFQLLRHFRRVAVEHSATRVELQDTAISTTLDSALRADGFSEGSPRAAVLGPSTATVEELVLNSSAEVVLAERYRWPLVIQNAQLPTFMIPIQPRWATNLLGLNDGLISLRRRGLGLSRELVYFSGSRIEPQELPARILWYATADRTTSIRKVVARSMLVDSARISADEAITRFKQVGVLRPSDITDAADRNGTVNVIRFQDTELLRQQISRHDEIFKRYVKDTVQSMQQVNPSMFDDVIAAQFDGQQSA